MFWGGKLCFLRLFISCVLSHVVRNLKARLHSYPNPPWKSGLTDILEAIDCAHFSNPVDI